MATVYGDGLDSSTIAYLYQLWYAHKMSAKRIVAVFFAQIGSREPVREWLKSMSREDQKRIGDDIRTVEFGWPIGMPVCRALGKGLYEVRTNLRDRTARVFFGIEDDEMVLLHGVVKKTQTTPEADLKLARKRLQEWRGD